MKKRAIFLDRDGTIIKEKHYLNDCSEVELIEGAAKGLRLLQEMGFKLVIITNQSGLKRGLITQQELEKIHNKLKRLLSAEDVDIDGIYFSPDLPQESSKTRKPEIGLLDKAVRELNLQLRGSYCIGDKKDDIEMGKRKGLKTILVLTGYGRKNPDRANPDYVARDLFLAALMVKRVEKQGT